MCGTGAQIGHMRSRHSTWWQVQQTGGCKATHQRVAPETWLSLRWLIYSKTDLKVEDPLRPLGKGLANLAHYINSCLA